MGDNCALQPAITTSLHSSLQWCGNQWGATQVDKLGHYTPWSVCDDSMMVICKIKKTEIQELSWLNTWKHCSTLLIGSEIRALNINKPGCQVRLLSILEHRQNLNCRKWFASVSSEIMRQSWSIMATEWSVPAQWWGELEIRSSKLILSQNGTQHLIWHIGCLIRSEMMNIFSLGARFLRCSIFCFLPDVVIITLVRHDSDSRPILTCQRLLVSFYPPHNNSRAFADYSWQWNEEGSTISDWEHC